MGLQNKEKDKKPKEASLVPNNWFGTGKFTAPKYAVSSGKDECDVCKHMLNAGMQSVSAPAASEAAGGEAGSESASPAPESLGAKKDLCSGLAPKYMDMCRGYEKYLTDCPSFKNDICHEDIG